MTATVVWSSNLRLVVKQFKEMKTITTRDIFQGQSITTVEEQAIRKQVYLKPKDDNIKCIWM